jgi:hypothetical protein
MCRTLENLARAIAGCRDTVIDDRGYMLPLEDADLIQMLEYVRDRSRHLIDGYLERIFEEISN